MTWRDTIAPPQKRVRVSVKTGLITTGPRPEARGKRGRCWAVAGLVSRFKGASSRILREEFAHLRSRLPTLWSRSYYAGSVGHVSDTTVRLYIAAQKGV